MEGVSGISAYRQLYMFIRGIMQIQILYVATMDSVLSRVEWFCSERHHSKNADQIKIEILNANYVRRVVFFFLLF